MIKLGDTIPVTHCGNPYATVRVIEVCDGYVKGVFLDGPEAGTTALIQVCSEEQVRKAWSE